jgi:hypothetical protein
MGLLTDLNSGKYNFILILILFIFMFHQYWCASSNAKSIKRCQCKEPMSNISNDIREAVKQVYLADVQAIRNLSEVASKLQRDNNLILPGNLTVTGQINANGQIIAGGEIRNNSFSLSGLNTKIDNTNTSLSNSITSNVNSINKNITNQVNIINNNLSKKYDKSGGTISGDVKITGYLTGTNFTMNTGSGRTIQTLGNQGQFLANGSVYFGAGACHGNTGAFGSCR